jgi:uncharacterized membrane protein
LRQRVRCRFAYNSTVCGDTVDAKAGRRVTDSTVWLIKRNCSASPRQLAAVFASIVALSFVIGVGFAALGLWLVLPFVGLEVLAVAAAFVCYGRHAVDYERIELRDGRLLVARQEGQRRSEFVFELPWVRVEVNERGNDDGLRARVELVTARSRVEVGRYLVDARRLALGRELRSALGQAVAR